MNIFNTEAWMTPDLPCTNTANADAWFDELRPTGLCDGCPAADNCLNYALTFKDPITGSYLEGIFAGTTTLERRKMRDLPKRHEGRKKTHCKRGHEFTDANTYVSKKGSRGCRTCRNINGAEWTKRQKGVAA